MIFNVSVAKNDMSRYSGHYYVHKYVEQTEQIWPHSMRTLRAHIQPVQYVVQALWVSTREEMLTHVVVMNLHA